MSLQLHKNSVLDLISWKSHHTYSFVIQKIMWKNCLGITIAAKIITKQTFQKNCFGTINIVKLQTDSLQSTFLCMFSCEQGQTSGSNKKCCGGIRFVIITETISKINVPRNYFGENQKGTAGRGRQKKTHDNLRHFATFYDNFRLFIPLT